MKIKEIAHDFAQLSHKIANKPLNYLLTELKVDFKLRDTPIYKNPSASDTEALMKTFFHNSARFVVDPDGNVFLWNAGAIIHFDVVMYLLKYDDIEIDEDGFTFSGPWDNEGGGLKYTVWSDSYLDETALIHLIKTEHMVKRMFGDNEAVFINRSANLGWNIPGESL